MRWAERRLDRETLWDVSVPGHGVAQCGKRPEGRRRSRPVLVGNDARSYYAGLRRCSSGWDCPYCMPQITSVRADEISLLVGSWIKAGNSAVGVTLTPRHDFSMRLGPLFDAVSEAFSWILNGRPWRRIKAELGIVGTIRVIEVTCGCNGWHPHVHAIFVIEGDRRTGSSYRAG